MYLILGYKLWGSKKRINFLSLRQLYFFPSFHNSQRRRQIEFLKKLLFTFLLDFFPDFKNKNRNNYKEVRLSVILYSEILPLPVPDFMHICVSPSCIFQALLTIDKMETSFCLFLLQILWMVGKKSLLLLILLENSLLRLWQQVCQPLTL